MPIAPEAPARPTVLELQLPGLIYRQEQDGESRTVWLLQPDGS